jgi:hypothetical protein
MLISSISFLSWLGKPVCPYLGCIESIFIYNENSNAVSEEFSRMASINTKPYALSGFSGRTV